MLWIITSDILFLNWARQKISMSAGNTVADVKNNPNSSNNMEEKIYEALKLVLNNSGSFNLTDTEKIIGNVNTNLNSARRGRLRQPRRQIGRAHV